MSSDAEHAACELSDLLHKIDDFVAEIEEQAKGAGSSRKEAIVVQNRTRMYEMLDELGEWLARFDAGDHAEAETQRIQDLLTHWLKETSVTGPAFARMRDLANGKSSYYELMQHLQTDRPAGADLSAMLLDDYYVHAQSTQAGQRRLALLGQELERQFRSHPEAEEPRVDFLCLQYIGGMEWEKLFRSGNLARPLSITCVDGSTVGARHAKQALAGCQGAKVNVVRNEPLVFLEDPQGKSEAFDVVYTLSLMDRLSDTDAGRLIRGAARVLRPGGVLITGNLTPAIPTSEKMLRKAMVDWIWQYRDEADWQRLYWGTPFAIDSVRIEYEPAKIAMLVTATRR